MADRPSLPRRLAHRLVRARRSRRTQRVLDGYAQAFFAVPEQTWGNATWRGVPVYKPPSDLWVYQEIVHEVRPDLIVETGTLRGGSTRYFADLLSLQGDGTIVSVDIEARERPAHPRIEYLTGSSVAPEIVERIHALAEGKRTLVVLDSLHTADHVLAELRTYASIVSPGSYLIVEDTLLDDPRYDADHGPGPGRAVEQFLAEDDRFVVDRSREKFLHTFHPGGYLRRR